MQNLQMKGEKNMKMEKKVPQTPNRKWMAKLNSLSLFILVKKIVLCVETGQQTKYIMEQDQEEVCTILTDKTTFFGLYT